MNTLLNLFGGSWHIVAGIGVAVAAVAASWFGGKKTGKVQERARSDVKAAKLESAQISAVAEKQAKNIEEAKNVQTTNNALTDDDARNKLRQSGFNNEQ
ncbi:hypothetical protein AAGQ96_12710 [Pantoea sp. MBD-2R]|uniref:hypothetical protein n=1 Tax=unclassified Pantoea TaxID=2630326 RepID=UPI0011BFA65D|nr:hypothetical protein [Pantoea sp. CCBC3-3-1]